jgi:glyoxylase-like metal-dependent hydrolase (beta-lactamase superfamily II)
MMWKKRQNHFTCKTFRKPDAGKEGKNQYLLINGDEAATIDVSASCDDVSEMLRQQRLTLKYLLVTHAHRSHLAALPELKAAFGAAFCICRRDAGLLNTSGVSIEPDLFVQDKTRLALGDGIIRVLHTPGHTPGSLCFFVKDMNVLFSGRTLEKGGYGTIWGPSSMAAMLSSLRRLNGNFCSAVVYPGRGESTTMRKEAWLDCLRSH